eukprot:8013281-Pyramimonas_sp.AAC.1
MDEWTTLLKCPLTTAASVLDSFVDSSRRIQARAQRTAVRESLHDFKQWVTDDPSANGILHKALKQQPTPPPDLEVEGKVLIHPAQILDQKAVAFRKLWAPRPPDLGEVREIFRLIREEAKWDSLPDITVEQVYRSTRSMKAKAGLGVDMMSPIDFQRLPCPAIQEL